MYVSVYKESLEELVHWLTGDLEETCQLSSPRTMLRVFLIWHILSSFQTSSIASTRTSCEQQWVEGVKLSRDRSTINGGGGGLPDDHNSSIIPSTTLHAALRDHWMEHYKMKLLRDLDMQSAPPPGSRRLPKSIRKQFEMIKAREGEDIVDRFEECPPSTSPKNEHVRDVIARGTKTTRRSRPAGWNLVNSKAIPMKKVISSTLNTMDTRFVHDSMRSYFELNGLSQRQIKNATLYIHTRQPAGIHHEDGAGMRDVHVRIYKYSNEEQVVIEPVTSQAFKMDFRRGVWLSIDLTRLVHQWARSPSTNYGIMVRAEHNGRDYVNRTVDDFNRTSAIILAMDVDDTYSTTTVLPAPEEPVCDPEGPDGKCCRYPLEVNFEAFGWDWVIAPKRFNAYYCAGSCPLNYKQMSPHAHLMQQLDLVSPADSPKGLGPCCTPQDYQDIKVLYIGQDKSIKESRIPAAIVLRCGCA